MSKPDYYQVLGVSQSATLDEIKCAYRCKARETHPDHNPGDEMANKKFNEVSNAYEELCKELEARQKQHEAEKEREHRGEQEQQEQYDQLLQAKNRASTEGEYQELAYKFRAMNGYKDTAKLADECDNQYRELRKKEESIRQEQRKRRIQKLRVVCFIPIVVIHIIIRSIITGVPAIILGVPDYAESIVEKIWSIFVRIVIVSLVLSVVVGCVVIAITAIWQIGFIVVLPLVLSLVLIAVIGFVIYALYFEKQR